jgi:hypothetical protein
MKKIFTFKGLRAVGALALLSAALSACEVDVAGFSSDYFGNHVSFAGSCNNSDHPTSSLYICVGTIAGEINGQSFSGRINDCYSTTACSDNGSTCKYIQTHGDFYADGTGMLGGVPVTFSIHAFKGSFGSSGNVHLMVVVAAPPHVTLFATTFPKNNFRLTQFNADGPYASYYCTV